MTDTDMDALLMQMEDTSEGADASSKSSETSTNHNAENIAKAKAHGPVPLSATGQPIWNPLAEIHSEVLRHRRKPEPLPSLYVEAERHKAVYALHTGFLRKCKEKGLDIKTPTFERWCFNQNTGSSDPVLPSGKCHDDEGLQQVERTSLCMMTSG